MQMSDIKVGHVYVGGKLNRMRRVLEVGKTGLQSAYVRWQSLPGRAVGYSGHLVFANWAKEDVSEMETR